MPLEETIMRMGIADAMSRIRIREDATAPDYIRYLGSRGDLIQAGIATADMFPAKGRKRKWLRGIAHSHTPEYFAVSRRGATRFLVTRWRGWSGAKDVATAAKAGGLEAALGAMERDERAQHLGAERPRGAITLTGDQLWAIEDMLDRFEEALAVMEARVAKNGPLDEDGVRRHVDVLRGLLKGASESLHKAEFAACHVGPRGMLARDVNDRYTG